MANYNKVISVKVYKLYYWTQRIIVWMFYKGLFGCVIEGRENIDYSRSFLIVSNHCSNMDPPLVGYAIPKPIAYMAKEELFKIPILNRMFHWSGGFAVNRGKDDPSFINNALYAISKGWLITVFPEGGRSYDGKLLPMKSGVARILLTKPVPLLPVALINTHRAMGKGKKVNFSEKIKVKIGKLVEPEEYMPPEHFSELEKIEHLKSFYGQKLRELLPEDQQ